MMRVLITGGQGQLGQVLTQTLSPAGFIFTPSRKQMDILDKNRVISVAGEFQPDIVIHCAAMTDVDACQQDPEQAFAINCTGTRHITLAARKTGAVLVYISSNFVFNGRAEQPYREWDEPDPLNIYGISKLKGEEQVRELVEKYYIIRTSWLYGPERDNFVNRICRLMHHRERLQVVGGQTANPTLTLDLARAVYYLLKSGSYGTYHLVNSGYCSRYCWVERIASLAGRQVQLERVSPQSFPGSAPRPQFAPLDSGKYVKITGQKLRPWTEALADYMTNNDLWKE